MQDDTQRPEAGAMSAQQPPVQQQPSAPLSPPQAPRTAPLAESVVAPRGLDQLRAEPPTAPHGFGTLGIAADPVDHHPYLGDTELAMSYAPEPQEPMYLPLALSVGAGFKFGCGFMLAVGVSMFGLFLVASVIFFVATLIGLTPPVAPR
ncbi:MAG: hypothetical protein IT305_25180 [Chloroflexi bacterium]|nr:hypothetical protein [Chloroflexota bacterium]